MDGVQRSVARLVDYIVVVAFDESQIRHGNSVGNIVQRFPKYDWPDISLSPSLEVFSQPQGWTVSSEVRPTTFFVSTLTDILGARQYACCLQIYEPCGNVIEDVDDGSVNGPNLYKPKVIVILSRFPFFDLFRNCLNRIHLALIDSENKAEVMVATLVSNVYLAAGGPAVSFCLGSERLTVRAPRSPTVPVTADKVALFMHQLGTIHNALTLLCAVLTDQKILFRSNSLSRLSDSCFALRALLYPFDYPHTYVPVLPELLIEYLESPTPYVMGVLNSVRIRNADLDAIVVDLDIGAVYVPPSINIPSLPELLAQRLISSLQMVMYPGLATADDAWKVGHPPFPSHEIQDKRIRACFVRMFAEMMSGYRCCLEVVRLHSPPLIVFHKSAFLGLRHFSSCSLIRSFLDTLLFQSFISERGLPYRICDLFDEFVTHSVEHVNEYASKNGCMESVVEIADKLFENERQESSFAVTPLLAHRRFTLPSSPTKLALFDENLVNDVVEQNIRSGIPRMQVYIIPKKVPSDLSLNMNEERVGAVSRRLQVLSSCLHYIFDSKLSDARKMLCAVELSMRSVNARVALCQLLWSNLSPVNKATLLPLQFELIIRLINCALNQESKEDEHGIAYAMLYLSNIYCRRLSAGVHQFAYTCIQDHPVWDNQQFWEAAFFHDVHKQIRRLYLPVKEDSDCPFSMEENITDTWSLMEKPSGLDLVSERLANISHTDDSELKKCALEENSIVFGQAKHYINLMVYMRVPLDVSKLRRVNVRELERRSDKNGRGQESDEQDAVSQSESDVESGFMEQDSNDLGTASVKWISRLIDRICSAAGLEQIQIERLCGEIPGFVALHIDNLEQVYTESKRLSPMHKPKLLYPALSLPSERVIMGGLRVFLLNDGRVIGSASTDSAQTVLPAEGAIFLTNYRIIFKGQPCDPFLCEQVVIRTMPVMSITKVKQINDQSLQNSSQFDGIPPRVAHQLHDAFQIRSSCFQLMKVAFDEEVHYEKAEEFIQFLNSLRWPSGLPQTLFAYSSVSSVLSSSSGSVTAKSKYGTIRDLKKSLIRNPLKDKKRIRFPQKALQYGNDTSNSAFGVTLPAAFTLHGPSSPSTLHNRTATSDYLDISGGTHSDATNLHHHYMLDYDRLGLSHGTFRLSNVNRKYEISKGYPNIVVVPSSVADDTFSKISKGFKHGRFPVATWKSDENALLIRGSGLTSQTVVARIKKQANLLGNVEAQSSGFSGSHISLNSRDLGAPNSVELQERYLSILSAVSPRVLSSSDGRSLLSESIESLLSLESVMTADGLSLSSNTPDIYRRTQTSDFTRHATNFVRNSGGKNGARVLSNGRYPACGENLPPHSRKINSIMPTQGSRSLLSITRNSLYIFGDRSQAKILKLDKSCEFIPVTFPTAHNVKIAFKKFLRAVCPSWVLVEDQSVSFYKQLDDSSWLQMVASLMNLSCAIADLIDVQHSSVAICLEDGWDATCQISALSQILLDPFYRTIDGFQVLVEKEWLAFGHRFSHRANHSLSSQNSGIAPMFLMFLDAVHQVMEQYPCAFEFNDFYLRFLGYHSSSAYFRTFLLDSEAERIHFDTLSMSADELQPFSVWSFINERRQSLPIFNNFCYTPELFAVLRPQASIASMVLWSFYSEDHLAHGFAYDIEVAELERQQREDEQLESLTEVHTPGTLSRRVLDASCCCMQLLPLDSFSFGVENYSRLGVLLHGDEKIAESWVDVMNLVEERMSTMITYSNEMQEQEMVYNWRRQIQRAVHKKETLKLLLRGITHQNSNPRVRDSVIASNTGHHFVPQHVTAGDTCAVCHQNVPGIVVRLVHRCSGCGMICHEKCSPLVSSNCPNNLDDRRRSLTPKPDHSSPALKRTPLAVSDTKTLTMSASRPHANATHCGFLMKKGATFKMWKPRWFVLDSSRHQLRYYESETDVSCRGVIELSDVKAVEVSSGHAFKKPLLEIKTSRRVYSLLADTKVEADLWMEKILASLRD